MLKLVFVSHCRKWDDYKLGFGKFQGKNDEYWLGNDHIYDLLARGASIFPPQISFQVA